MVIGVIRGEQFSESAITDRGYNGTPRRADAVWGHTAYNGIWFVVIGVIPGEQSSESAITARGYNGTPRRADAV